MKFSSVSFASDSTRSLNESPTPSPNSNSATVKSVGIQNIYFQNKIPQGVLTEYILNKLIS